MLFVNDTRIERVNANGTDLQYVYQGTDNSSHTHLQFCRIPDNYASLNLDLNSISILRIESTGTRRGASPYSYTSDKITNYAYVPSSSNLVVGKKYSYLLATSGQRTAKRNLSDGTVINCRGYNYGDTARIKNLTMSNVQSGAVSNRAQYNFQGNFIYNPKTIIATGGSAEGHLIAKGTYSVSDPGKGGIVVWIYEYTCLESLFAYAYARTGNSQWVFNETVYSN